MKTRILAFTLLASFACSAMVQDDVDIKADKIAVDNVTKAAVATGHVAVTCGVLTLHGEALSRDADGTIHLGDSTWVTTCTNDIGHTHWNVSGSVEFKPMSHVKLWNCWVELYEIPLLYLPYFWYPLDTDCGFSWMVGWKSKWGAYLLTKTRYHILGDASGEENAYWLKGATLVDLREKPGIGVGEDLEWNLSEYGHGSLNLYHAWDKYRYREGRQTAVHEGSEVKNRRYGIGLKHLWLPTERDIVRLKGHVYSDTYFHEDFTCESFFSLPSSWFGYDGNEVAWEHFESGWGSGVSASGPLNEFYSGIFRMPEIYFDINPTPLFGLPINYESQSRVGYMGRQAAEYRKHMRFYSYNPGVWADYETFRMDTYHRLTAPFRMLDDTISVVPRFAYRGTYWNSSGGTDLEGLGRKMPGSVSGGDLYRSILEGGITFAARGTGWINDTWQHMFEPYTDVLAQEAMYNNLHSGKRPYFFDGVEGSLNWEDQFANRGRDLPYSYYGVTPGVRQAWSALDENGKLRRIFDLDVYTALQFNEASWYGDDDLHKLAKTGSPNYGDNSCLFIPGVRARWMPSDDLSLFGHAEYNSENNKIASAALGLKHEYSKTFNYEVLYLYRDTRWWDYSSTPGYRNDDRVNRSSYDWDDLNRMVWHMVRVSAEWQPLDWFKFGPQACWDLREGELEDVGCFFDYLTDCLGFRFMINYRNTYITYDGYEHDDDWSFGFLIYLRALGEDSAQIFKN